jgi:hypothetical protein
MCKTSSYIFVSDWRKALSRRFTRIRLLLLALDDLGLMGRLELLTT